MLEDQVLRNRNMCVNGQYEVKIHGLQNGYGVFGGIWDQNAAFQWGWRFRSVKVFKIASEGVVTCFQKQHSQYPFPAPDVRSEVCCIIVSLRRLLT
jgi:hypothetical protein